MCRVLCVSSAFWKWNSGRRILLNKSSPLAFCVLGYGILSTTLGMGDWISDGDNDYLLFGNCISDGDNDDSLTLNHEIACQQKLQNGYWPGLCKRHFLFFCWWLDAKALAFCRRSSDKVTPPSLSEIGWFSLPNSRSSMSPSLMHFQGFCLQLIEWPLPTVLYWLPVLHEFSYSTLHTLTVLYEK